MKTLLIIITVVLVFCVLLAFYFVKTKKDILAQYLNNLNQNNIKHDNHRIKLLLNLESFNYAQNINNSKLTKLRYQLYDRKNDIILDISNMVNNSANINDHFELDKKIVIGDNIGQNFDTLITIKKDLNIKYMDYIVLNSKETVNFQQNNPYYYNYMFVLNGNYNNQVRDIQLQIKNKKLNIKSSQDYVWDSSFKTTITNNSETDLVIITCLIERDLGIIIDKLYGLL